MREKEEEAGHGPFGRSEWCGMMPVSLDRHHSEWLCHSASQQPPGSLDPQTIAKQREKGRI